MPSGIPPKVNPAREFFEIANDFADPKEILREALSNSYDASATDVKISFRLQYRPESYSAKMIMIDIEDNGNGMSSIIENPDEPSDIETFFNLGDSKKTGNLIGSKGHGSKIYYKSKKIIVDTWKNRIHLHAETEDKHLWESLCNRKVPTYCYDENPDTEGKGTIIRVEDFKAKQNDFKNTANLIQYIRWHTIVGSFEHYFHSDYKQLDVFLKAYGEAEYSKIDFGFTFPEENADLSSGSRDFCKIIGPKSIEVPLGENKKVVVQIIGAFLGENKRDFIPQTYWDMGLWLCKDFIKIERTNDILDAIFGGEYYYRNFFILANCPQFDLTANRNSIRKATEEYEVAIEEIKAYIKKEFKESSTWEEFFGKKREEKKQEDKQKEIEKIQERISKLEEVITNYQTRTNLKTDSSNLLIKEPRNEAETALLLQSMISSRHPSIDFRIGGYNATRGTDLIVESESKGTHKVEWAEIVYTLANLFKWSHPTQSFHKIICWEIGNFDSAVKEENGHIPTLVPKIRGRYNLNIGTDTIEVYVLKEILYNK